MTNDTENMMADFHAWWKATTPHPPLDPITLALEAMCWKAWRDSHDHYRGAAANAPAASGKETTP